MSAFEIVETLMCPRITRGHPSSSLLAQESGCFLLLVDLTNDKKIKMHRHETEIEDIILSEDYLISVDSGPKASVLISSTNSLKRITQFYLPTSKSSRNKPAFSIRMAFSPKYSRIIIVESGLEGGYRMSGWDLKRDNDVKLFFIADIDTPERCLQVQAMETRINTLLIVTCESHMVKYWKMNQKQAELTNRIHVKEELSSILVEQSNNVVLALTKSGKILLLNDTGDYLTTIRGDRPFTTMANHQNFCFFGTSDGSVVVYDMKTVTRLSEVAYSSEAKLPFLIDESDKYSNDINEEESEDGLTQTEYSRQIQPPQDIKLTGSSYLKIMGKGPAVAGLALLHDGSMLGITHADGLFIVQNLSENSVCYSSFSHFQRVNAIHWHEEMNSCFFSVGNEGYFAVWQLYHDRWIPKVYDLHKTINEYYLFLTVGQYISDCTLRDVKVSSVSAKKNGFIQITSATQGINPPSTEGKTGKRQQLKVTCLAVNYDYREIYLGDNKGSITVINLDGYNVKAKHKVCNFKIKRITVTPQHGYVAIVLSTGMSLILSILHSFQIALKIEDHIVAHATPQSSIIFKQIFCFTDLTTKNEDVGIIPSTLKSSGLRKNGLEVNEEGIKGEIQPFMQSSLNRLQVSNYFSDLNGQTATTSKTKKQTNTNGFLAISAHSSNSLRLHNIAINLLDDSVTGLAMMVYSTEGKIASCDLHPSKDYILILDEIGLCYLYKIRSGELRGRIEVPLYSSNLAIDPSGLYFVLSSHSDQSEDYQTKQNDGSDEEQDDQLARQNKGGIVKVLSMKQVLGSTPSPLTITKEISRDLQQFDHQKVSNSEAQLSKQKKSKHLIDIDSFFNSTKKAIRPKQVLLFELGTGKKIGEIQSLFETSSLGFSANSEYIHACSTRGAISIWAPVSEISDNIIAMFHYIENEPNFWQQFPIYIKKNLIDVRQLKQNLKNIVNLDHLQDERVKEYKTAQQKPNQLKQNLSPSKSPPIRDFQLIQFQKAHDDQISHLSPIQKKSSNLRRNINFDRAYANIENKRNLQQEANQNYTSLKPTTNNISRQNGRVVDQPIKLQPDTGKRYHLKQHIENHISGERQNKETPDDIDDDVDQVYQNNYNPSHGNYSQVASHPPIIHLQPTSHPYSIANSQIV